jgi:hypothetical protein
LAYQNHSVGFGPAEHESIHILMGNCSTLFSEGIVGDVSQLGISDPAKVKLIKQKDSSRTKTFHFAGGTIISYNITHGNSNDN